MEQRHLSYLEFRRRQLAAEVAWLAGRLQAGTDVQPEDAAILAALQSELAWVESLANLGECQVH